MKNRYLLFILPFWVLSCKDAKKSAYFPLKDTVGSVETQEPAKQHPGKKIMETECYVCHDPKASQHGMIAPPLYAVKEYYLDGNTSKEQFTADLIQWVNDPETESKMPEALFEFGSMPYIPYPADAITQIADYMYGNDLEKPDWYETAKKGDNATWINRNLVLKETQENNIRKGSAYTKAAQTTLGQNLIKAIGEKGTTGAITFCNTKALALTDSVSVMNNAIVKRATDKPRNLLNKANEEELGYIAYFKKLVTTGKEPKPILKSDADGIRFYFPITTNAMCLQCHGKPNEHVLPETLAALKNLYPADQAMGYDANEVRGIWAVSFDQ